MILLWAPVVVYMAAIVYGATAASVPQPVSNWPDTLLHGGGYFGLALLTLRALARGRWSGVTIGTLLLAWGISMVHGVAVEWLQMHVPTRTAEWRDLVNNGIGAAVALVAARAWGIMRSTSRAKPNS